MDLSGDELQQRPVTDHREVELIKAAAATARKQVSSIGG
jgi:hypothetical protein